MAELQHVPIAPLDPRRFRALLLPAEADALEALIRDGRRELQGRVVWNVNSTARGGGVAELLHPLLGYSRGGGVDARWLVITGDARFFGITKRLHNRLHGFKGDQGELGAEERVVYERTSVANAAALVPLIHERDVVILHDPQTAGMVAAVRRTGATVIWRCHVGRANPNGIAHEAHDFLDPYLADADAFVFSRASFAWAGLREERIFVIPPSIDAFSPKNAEQNPEQSHAILAAAGIVPSSSAVAPVFTRSDGTPGRVDRRAHMVQERPLTPEDQIVLQVARWDHLKDPVGVLKAFSLHVAPRSAAHLLLVGPAPGTVADDPEAPRTLAAVEHVLRGLPTDSRGRVHLASLPMDDVEENAAIVNALQRRATVVVQKSLAEGFGLVVTEAMWKSRPVVASRVGGIEDQIIDGESGLLIPSPRDLEAFGMAILALLSDPVRAARIGAAAHRRVRDEFLAPQHLRRYFDLIHLLVVDREGVPA